MREADAAGRSRQFGPAPSVLVSESCSGMPPSVRSAQPRKVRVELHAEGGELREWEELEGAHS